MVRGSADFADGRNPSQPPGMRRRERDVQHARLPRRGGWLPGPPAFPSLSRERRSVCKPELPGSGSRAPGHDAVRCGMSLWPARALQNEHYKYSLGKAQFGEIVVVLKII
ncbi:unnamed protein product [Coccothraustes coccothraustes]